MSLAKEKCLVIEGPSDFAGTAFAFQYVFGDRSQFTDYREVRKQLKKHPFFERMLEEPGSKRRKLTHSSYSSQVVNGMCSTFMQTLICISREPFCTILTD